MTTVKDHIEHMKNSYKPEDIVAVAVWQVDDVLERAKEREIKLTREQAEEIIHRIDRKASATLGITWDTIDCYTDDHLA